MSTDRIQGTLGALRPTSMKGAAPPKLQWIWICCMNMFAFLNESPSSLDMSGLSSKSTRAGYVCHDDLSSCQALITFTFIVTWYLDQFRLRKLIELTHFLSVSLYYLEKVHSLFKPYVWHGLLVGWQQHTVTLCTPQLEKTIEISRKLLHTLTFKMNTIDDFFSPPIA